TAVTTGVPFKATAGLHHAVRNTDPKTGFDQHGFVNLLAAVDAVLSRADTDEAASPPCERARAVPSARPGALSDDRAAEVRRRFLSSGTCSIAEPLEDLLGLGLVPSTVSPLTEGTNA